jgi:hypothetical protein
LPSEVCLSRLLIDNHIDLDAAEELEVAFGGGREEDSVARAESLELLARRVIQNRTGLRVSGLGTPVHKEIRQSASR